MENNHTYFVGTESILVHNACDKLTDKQVDSLRSKAGREAKKQALEELNNLGDLTPSKVNKWAQKWGLDPTDVNDRKIIDFVSDNKRFPSYASGDGIQCDFAHGTNVADIVKAYKNGKISAAEAKNFISNPNNGLLTSRQNHLSLLHKGKWTNSTSITTAVTLRPNVADVMWAVFNAVM